MIQTQHSNMETVRPVNGGGLLSRGRKKKGAVSPVRPGHASPIRRVRTLRGLTQEQAGERSKMSYQQIGHLEREGRKTKLYQLKQLAEGMDVLPSDLLGERDELSVPLEFLVGLGTSAAMPAEGPALLQPFERLPPPAGLTRSHQCFAARLIDASADRRYAAGSDLFVRRAVTLDHRFRLKDIVLVAHYGLEQARRDLHEVLVGILDRSSSGDILALTRSNDRHVPPALVVRDAGQASAAIADDVMHVLPGGQSRVEILGRIEYVQGPA